MKKIITLIIAGLLICGCMSTAFAKSYIEKTIKRSCIDDGGSKYTVYQKYPYFTGNSALAKATNNGINNYLKSQDKRAKITYTICRSGGKFNSIVFTSEVHEPYVKTINYGIINGKVTKITHKHLSNLGNFPQETITSDNQTCKFTKGNYYHGKGKFIYLSDVFGQKDCFGIDNFTISLNKIQWHSDFRKSVPLNLSTYFRYK